MYVWEQVQKVFRKFLLFKVYLNWLKYVFNKNLTESSFSSSMSFKLNFQKLSIACNKLFPRNKVIILYFLRGQVSVAMFTYYLCMVLHTFYNASLYLLWEQNIEYKYIKGFARTFSMFIFPFFFKMICEAKHKRKFNFPSWRNISYFCYFFYIFLTSNSIMVNTRCFYFHLPTYVIWKHFQENISHS